MRWQSRGSLVMGRRALTTGGPKVMLGTKWPSMTSMWTMVPPPRSAAATSSARWAKSEARMEKASSIMGSGSRYEVQGERCAGGSVSVDWFDRRLRRHVLGFGGGFWFAQRHAGGGVEDAADGPGGFIGRVF